MWLANQSEIKQNTNLWRWVGRRVLPLPVWDVNAFFWGLPDTNFKWRTTVGRTHALSWVNPLSPNPMDSKQMDVIHLTPTVPATDSRLKRKQSGHLCWFSSKPVTTLNLSRLATSEAATPRTSVILRTVITGRSFLLKMVCLVIPTSLRAEYLKDLQTGYLAREKKLCWNHRKHSFDPGSRIMQEMQLSYVTYARNTSLLNKRNH